MSPTSSGEAVEGTSSGFGTTEWSLVLAAGRQGDDSEALGNLCRKYWRPMYVHIRHCGIPAADAEDMTQGFFVYLIEKDLISQADPNRGSFRALLRTLLNHYLANRQRIQRAEKRTSIQISIDSAEGERALAEVAAAGADPSAAYEASWARAILQTAWERLAAEQETSGRIESFSAVRPFVTQAAEAGDYDRLSRLLGLRRGQVAVLIHRLSRRYAELIRSEVANTLADRSDLDGELRHLLLLTAT